MTRQKLEIAFYVRPLSVSFAARYKRRIGGTNFADIIAPVRQWLSGDTDRDSAGCLMDAARSGDTIAVVTGLHPRRAPIIVGCKIYLY
ncbi:unnamed protein product [Leptosia nina]|uniref:Uncharacterized protein n=1 Tax=Leptosia nina TaxID=320188 RepID=A0AAV1JNW9_9NEOP